MTRAYFLFTILTMEDTNNRGQNNVFYQKGLDSLKRKNYAYAFELFQGVLENNPGFSECRHYLWLSARENMRIASPLKKIFNFCRASILSLKLIYLSTAGNYQQAVSAAENIILLLPDNIPAYRKLAILFMRQDDIKSAVTAFEEILFIDKYNFPALKSLCGLYFKQKDYKKARTTANILLKINPHVLEAENILKDIDALGAIDKGFDELKPAS